MRPYQTLQEKELQKEKSDFAGKKVLLVEDNELNQEIASTILSEAGFTVDIANDGDVAVNKMKKASVGQYDLILMDIQNQRWMGMRQPGRSGSWQTDKLQLFRLLQ